MSNACNCDCINTCGDDPFLALGKAHGCPSFLARKEKEERVRSRERRVNMAVLMASQVLIDHPVNVPTKVYLTHFNALKDLVFELSLEVGK